MPSGRSPASGGSQSPAWVFQYREGRCRGRVERSIQQQPLPYVRTGAPIQRSLQKARAKRESPLVSSSGGRRSGGAADVVYGLLVRGSPIAVGGGFASREVSFDIEKQGKEDEESSAGASPSRRRRTSINGSLSFDGRQFQDAHCADQQIDLQALVESQSASSTVPQRRTPSRTSRVRVSNPPSRSRHLRPSSPCDRRKASRI
jgi:hypothetical protein